MPRKQFSPGVKISLVQRPHGSLYKAGYCTSQRRGPQNQCHITNTIPIFSLHSVRLNHNKLRKVEEQVHKP